MPSAPASRRPGGRRRCRARVAGAVQPVAHGAVLRVQQPRARQILESARDRVRLRPGGGEGAGWLAAAHRHGALGHRSPLGLQPRLRRAVVHLGEDVERVVAATAPDHQDGKAEQEGAPHGFVKTSAAPARRRIRAASPPRPAGRTTSRPTYPWLIRGSCGAPLKSGSRDSNTIPATVKTIAPSSVPSYSTLIIGGIASSGLPPVTSGNDSCVPIVSNKP